MSRRDELYESPFNDSEVRGSYNSPLRNRNLLSAINRAGRAGFGHNHFREQRQLRFQSFPDPDGDFLARRIFKAGNFVQVPVIQPFPNRLERCRDIRVIHQPAEPGVAFARHDNVHFETVPVQPPALVRLRQSRQQMRRFKLKRFSEFNFHKNSRREA